MNKERMLQLADHLERVHEDNFFMPKIFSGADVENDSLVSWPNLSEPHCGTTACVAGHAVHLFATNEQKSTVAGDIGFSIAVAEEVLGLSESTAHLLFHGVWETKKSVVADWHDMTAKEAATEIRHIVEKGEENEPSAS